MKFGEFMEGKNNVLRTEKNPIFLLSLPYEPPSRFVYHATIFSFFFLCPLPPPYWIHFFLCFLWQNNTLGIHFRWFIDVTWLCCSYFTCFDIFFRCAFQSCLSKFCVCVSAEMWKKERGKEITNTKKPDM